MLCSPLHIDDLRIVMLYDGACRLCRRSVRIICMLDWCSWLVPVDFHDHAQRMQYAGDISFRDLNRALHIRILDRQGMVRKTLCGFDAFRTLCWHLPLLWPLAPFLFVPGIPPIGRKVYARIAASRNRCSDGYCVHERHADR